MFDINFYCEINKYKKSILKGEKIDASLVRDLFEKSRSLKPHVYSIETTNACNMRCKMCPRTTLMTRPIESMSSDAYKILVDQIQPHSDASWKEWESFVAKEYEVFPNDVSENHFFLYIIAKSVILHGFGEPLLDPKITERVGLLTDRGVPTYFSCNPYNIRKDALREIFANGLGYIKFSIESVDDSVQESIRGEAGSFEDNYKKIMQLIEMKEKYNYDTEIVITMINFNRDNQLDDFHKLKESFNGTESYVYLKSLDQKWYGSENYKNASVHWREFCQAPWTFCVVKSNGDVVQCMEDYNNEMVFGNVLDQSLEDIWNSQMYKDFREKHFTLDDLSDRCTSRCDMTLIGQCVL